MSYIRISPTTGGV